MNKCCNMIVPKLLQMRLIISLGPVSHVSVILSLHPGRISQGTIAIQMDQVIVIIMIHDYCFITPSHLVLNPNGELMQFHENILACLVSHEYIFNTKICVEVTKYHKKYVYEKCAYITTSHKIIFFLRKQYHILAKIL